MPFLLIGKEANVHGSVRRGRGALTDPTDMIIEKFISPEGARQPI